LDSNYIKEIMAIFDKTSFEGVGCVYGAQIPINTREAKEGKRASNGFKILLAIYEAINASICWLFFLQKPSKHGRFRLSGHATYPSSAVATIVETESASSAYLACYKDVFNEFRFDENLQGYAWGEDNDLAYRLSRKYKIIFTPQAKVIHKVSQTSRISTYEYNRIRIENHFYIFRKDFPQALRNRFALNMSVLGLLLILLEEAIIHRDWQGVRGFCDGLRAVHIKQ
jgi:GT2 family glycosyltransferase